MTCGWSSVPFDGGRTARIVAGRGASDRWMSAENRLYCTASTTKPAAPAAQIAMTSSTSACPSLRIAFPLRGPIVHEGPAFTG